MTEIEPPTTNNHVRAFAKQTLRSGTIKGVVHGCFQPGSSGLPADLIIAHETSLDLYTKDAELASICTAPVFGNILGICRISKPLPSNADVCAVLAESGQLLLVYVEEYNPGKLRFRLLDQIHAGSSQGMDPGQYSMLRKVVSDPLSRALVIVSWTNTLELLETQRIMIVAAVIDSATEAFSLHLFESWVQSESVAPPVRLLAKLPMPHDMSMPLQVAVLPAIPERILLITEHEAVFVSAVQILSGDVHLCRMPLPVMDDDSSTGPDCGMLIGAQTLGVPAGASAVGMSQRLVMGMQSGALLRVDVSDRPSIRFAKILDLSSTGSKMAIGDYMVHLGSGSLFVAGDCVDHTIIQISTFETDMPTMTASPVLASQSPLLDLAINSGSHLAYWTSGRMHTGAIHEARFGRTVQCLYTLDTGLSEGDCTISRAWGVTMHNSLQCVVMTTINSCVAACVDRDNSWRIHEELQQWLSAMEPVFVGNAGPRIVCVSKDSLDILDSLQTRRIANASDRELFTHGASTVLGSISIAAVVVRLPLGDSNVSWPCYYRSAIRVFDICAQELVFEDMLGSEVSAPYLAIGTYGPRMIIYRICDSGALEQTSTSLAYVINDIFALCTSDRSCLLIGLRNGTLVKAHVHTSTTGPFSLGEAVEDQIGGAPVKFTPVPEPLSPPTISSSKVVVLSGSLHTAELIDHGYMRMVPCIGSDFNLPNVLHLLPLFAADSCFFGISDSNAISIQTIDFSSQCHIRTLPVGDEPRRILVDRDTGMLVVAAMRWQLSDSPPIPTSSLKVIDPRDGTLHAESRLQKNEAVFALSHWHVQGRKSYCFVCVRHLACTLLPVCLHPIPPKARKRPGAVASPISSAASSPRLQPQPDASYDLKFRWESARSGPVTALAPLGDSYLCCEVVLRFLVTCVHVSGNQIAVGSQRESVHLFEFTADARFLSPSMVVGADRNGFVFAMATSADNSDEFACRDSWSATCTDLITLCHGVRDASRRADAVLASTITGAMWSFVRVSEQAFDLVKLLEEALLATRPAYNLQQQSVVDGELSTLMVVASSLELRTTALAMSDFASPPDDSSRIATAASTIRTLIQGLNRACLY
ncbi:hypothetical protein DL89DRAFT_291970 [Linderina pennispora]|uniref:Cleavage/polyadenylation specificity factor A subunit N-terminal domain-containing protein n=1 Tax=Linderina pennispora TaxID=61395 RepID=A0A1Y1WDR5_9FUNG|nr:uncharacterized protein DL89DRAFT_291970 [Linderina pennispora]ORX71478.1 hypothetical protein DL89DRAFT_291970 [Linderina pennispora]